MINEVIFVRTIAFKLVAFDGVVGTLAVVVDDDVEDVTSRSNILRSP